MELFHLNERGEKSGTFVRKRNIYLKITSNKRFGVGKVEAIYKKKAIKERNPMELEAG